MASRFIPFLQGFFGTKIRDFSSDFGIKSEIIAQIRSADGRSDMLILQEVSQRALPVLWTPIFERSLVLCFMIYSM